MDLPINVLTQQGLDPRMIENPWSTRLEVFCVQDCAFGVHRVSPSGPFVMKIMRNLPSRSTALVRQKKNLYLEFKTKKPKCALKSAVCS